MYAIRSYYVPRSTVLENVELPLLYAGVSQGDRKTRAMKALAKVGIEDKAMNHPFQLSGGQQQRVSIARALAGDPSLILADEPTGALDSKTSREVLDLLVLLNEEGNTIVLITHDTGVACEAKRVVKMHDGKIVFDGPVEDVITSYSIHYTKLYEFLTPPPNCSMYSSIGVPKAAS